MPIRPPPYTCTCPQCGWTQTVAPRSDALGPGEHVSRCPSCGHGSLITRPAHALAATLAAGLHTLGRLWRR